MTKSEQTAPELLPCPICGKSAKQTGSNMIECTDAMCGVTMDWGHWVGEGAAEKMAAAWNRRTPDGDDAGLIARLMKPTVRHYQVSATAEPYETASRTTPPDKLRVEAATRLSSLLAENAIRAMGE